mmetsp:Transcript_6100/g.13776  ORF Transcript_6100/g.13776 Transcript_6100/m.13776 type:complete len:175 (-) Transcript_6100:1612-2136(-)
MSTGCHTPKQYSKSTFSAKIHNLLSLSPRRFGQASSTGRRSHTVSSRCSIGRGYFKDSTRKQVETSYYYFCPCSEIGSANTSQNIDGLEAVAGVNPERLVEAHGHFRSASCIECGTEHDPDDCKTSMLERGEAPECEACGGQVKPSIVFFGDLMPTRYNGDEEILQFEAHLSQH